MVEVMFAIRKDGFKAHPAVISDLDLVEEDDQFTHLLQLDDVTTGQDQLSECLGLSDGFVLPHPPFFVLSLFPCFSILFFKVEAALLGGLKFKQQVTTAGWLVRRQRQQLWDRGREPI